MSLWANVHNTYVETLVDSDKKFKYLYIYVENHLEKYKILIEITDICLYVIEHIQKQGKKENQGMTSEKTYLRTWKDTNMAVVDTLLKDRKSTRLNSSHV